MRRRPVVVAAVAAFVVGIAAFAEITTEQPAGPAAERVAVAGTELVCPFSPVEDQVRSTLSMVAAQGLAEGAVGQAEEGSTTLGAVDAVDSLAGPDADRLFVTVTAPETGRYVANGTGSRAPGLALENLTVSQRAEDFGLSGVTCGPAVNDAWFVGAGSGVGRDARVHLVNPDPTPATVNVEIFGAEGRVEAPGASGVEVPATGATELSLTEVAPGSDVTALHVVAVAGRVGVGVRETEVEGLQPRGADWLPRAEPPAQRVVVPGSAAGDGSRQLSLFAPGTGTVTVDVSVVGEQGAFLPTGGGSVDLDRGRVSTLDLSEALTADEAAVLIESPVPITAGLRRQTSGERAELAFSSASPELTGATVVPGLLVSGGMSSQLYLTAPAGAAQVRLRLLVSGEEQGEARVVEIGEQSTVRVPAAEGVEDLFAVVVEPTADSGPVHAAVVRTQEVDGVPAMTVSTLRPTRAVVDVPAARQDLGIANG